MPRFASPGRHREGGRGVSVDGHADAEICGPRRRFVLKGLALPGNFLSWPRDPATDESRAREGGACLNVRMVRLGFHGLSGFRRVVLRGLVGVVRKRCVGVTQRRVLLSGRFRLRGLLGWGREELERQFTTVGASRRGKEEVSAVRLDEHSVLVDGHALEQARCRQVGDGRFGFLFPEIQGDGNLDPRQAALPGFGYGQGRIECEDEILAVGRRVPRQNGSRSALEGGKAENGRKEEPDQPGRGVCAHGLLLARIGQIVTTCSSF